MDGKEILDKAREVFTGFRWQDAVDILVVMSLIFFVLLYFKRTDSLKYAVAIVIAAAGVLCFKVFESFFPASGAILSVAGSSLIIVTVIIFSREIRRDIFSLNISKRLKLHFTNAYGASDEDLNTCVVETVRALLSLAKNNVGALLVFCSNELPAHIIDSGTRLDALVSSPLISSIFNTKAPLHDGAVVIHGNKIIAAGCFLPLSQDLTIPKELGTRHRAALGISETADVLTIIVSEETGVISVARAGELARYYDSGMLTKILEAYFGLRSADSGAKKKKRWK
ncbi:MAG: diadenylate cyclase [Clostridiales bacterium]|jgi:diadenylate cyclase|nr:diadenylate cyclase [Clostridiales bacterium]